MRRPDYIHAALNRLLESSDLLTISLENRKIVIISDFHLGDCSKADNFYPNRNIGIDLLTYYGKKGYFLIINGDFEELWQFSAESVRNAYRKVFSLMDLLFQGKIYRIYGNHDEPDLLPKGDRGCIPCLMIRRGEKRPFLVTHGHLGSTESDLYGWFSKIIVFLFSFAESFLIRWGIIKAPRCETGYSHDFEYVHEEWARRKGIILICGHSHRAVFASCSHYERLKKSKRRTLREKANNFFETIKEIRRNRHLSFQRQGNSSFYFNCGCGLYKKGITAIELDETEIKLVKWEKDRRMIYHSKEISKL